MFVQHESEKAHTSFVTKIWIVLGVVFLFTLMTTVILYSHTHTLIKTRLYDRLGAIVQTAALQLQTGEYADSLQGSTTIPVELPEYLRAVANVSPMLSRVYVVYSAPNNAIDYYGIDSYNKDTPFFGSKRASELDFSSAEVLHQFVVTTNSFIAPRGEYVTAYAPITLRNGTKMSIAIDVHSSQYYAHTHAVLYPFVVFVFCLLTIIALLTWLLLRTNKQQLRTMLETDRQKDELLSIVSHQLATPISSMQYLLEMFQDGDFGKLTKKQAEQVTKLQSSVHNASDLVRMILDVSRIQMGKMVVHRTEFNLEQFIDGIIDVVQPKIAEKKLKFITTITRPMPDVMLDERLLRMTILNLVSNAAKYTDDKGTIWFEASVRNNYFYCKVTDTGVGIPMEEQKFLYEKLYRATNVRESITGTGFGLYVAKGAIEAQGGTIQFHSKEGKGTTFYIQVPIKPED